MIWPQYTRSFRDFFQRITGNPLTYPPVRLPLTLLNLIAPEGLAPESDQTTAAGRSSFQSAGEFARQGRNSHGQRTRGSNQNRVAYLDCDAQGDVNRLRANVEDWYNSAMDRVAGWYKRRVQIIILFLGLGIAVALNVDTSYIAQRLANDSALRKCTVGCRTELCSKEQRHWSTGRWHDSRQSTGC